MPIEIRSLGPDDAEALLDAAGVPFGFALPEDPEARTDRIDRFTSLFEPERARCAFDGDRMVGTLGVFSLDMTLPGGSADCAGTTIVTVHPTHRRQGVLRRMMDAHLHEARERGDAIAALWASDSAIYGRFGFGLAAMECEVELDPSTLDLHRLAPEPWSVELIDGEAAAELLPQVYAQFAPTRPGAYRRTAAWWEHRRLLDRPDDRDGFTPFRYALARDPEGDPAGYAQYRMKGGWEDHHGSYTVAVRELIGLAPSAWSALWRFLWSHDLTTRLRAPHRPVDDPLFDLLAAPRRAAPTVTDALWVRILDVVAALEARRYPADGALLFEVADPMGLVEGSYRLEVEGGMASCRPTDAEGAMRLDVEDLGACLLGHARFRALARAGRVEGDPDALIRADALFAWDPAPWCPEVF